MILPSLYKTDTSRNERVITLLHQLFVTQDLTDEELRFILDHITLNELNDLSKLANQKRLKVYGKKVYMRGLIEFSNYCNRPCQYCGIQAANKKLMRYRLSKEEILSCVEEGLMLGFNTFVLQSGEDCYHTDDILVDLIQSIKQMAPNCAITLSIGERSKESYQVLYNAGCDRYLLRHETASKTLYEALHPSMSFTNRLNCLMDLKDIGYQVGGGFMVGLPNQTNGDLLNDIRFLQKLAPHMCGIGPYICHSDTPLRGNESGTIEQTLVMVALIRLILPKVLLPATTALGTLDILGREKALKSGANVVMPNLTQTDYRKQYELYQNKICLDDDARKCRGCIEIKINLSGFEVDMSRGDHVDFVKQSI